MTADVRPRSITGLSATHKALRSALVHALTKSMSRISEATMNAASMLRSAWTPTVCPGARAALSSDCLHQSTRSEPYYHKATAGNFSHAPPCWVQPPLFFESDCTRACGRTRSSHCQTFSLMPTESCAEHPKLSPVRYCQKHNGPGPQRSIYGKDSRQLLADMRGGGVKLLVRAHN